MSATLFEVNGQRYVSGLMWMSIYDKAAYKKEAKKHAADLSFDLVAYIQSEDVIQVGLATSSEVDGRNAYSFAATLRDAINQRSWAGVFRISESIWTYVAVKNGLIHPGSDICSDSVGDLITKLAESAASGEFENIYAPEGMLEQATPLRVIDILPDRPAKTALIKPVSFKLSGGLVMLGFLVLCLAGGGVGYLKWQEQKTREAAAKAAALAALRSQAEISPPWTMEAMPSAIFAGCTRVVFPLPMTTQQWAIGDATCGKTDVMIAYRRNGGTAAGLLNALPAAQINQDGETAVLSLPLGVEPKREAADLMPMGHARLALATLFQSIDVTFTIGELVASAPDGAVPLAPHAPFTARFEALPVDLGLALDRIPGLVLSTMKWNAGDLNWEVSGVIYGK